MDMVFVGDGERTYLFPGHPPVIVQSGQTVDVPYDPEDGCWVLSQPNKTTKSEPVTAAPQDMQKAEED